MKMKNIVILSLSILFFVACNNNNTDQSEVDTSVLETDSENVPEPEITFDHVAHDFGKITEGESVEHTFKFKNTGKSDLLLSSVTASCGCTTPNWPKEPIAPGESDEIKVVFNSAGKSGLVSKDVTILANTNPVKTILQIKVEIDKK